jgi:membrane protein required for colicin V production
MNIADWAIVGVIVVSAAVAASDGFIHQAFGIAGLIVGYLLAAWQYHRVADWFAPHVKSPWLSDIAGFMAIFLAVVVIAAIVARVIRWAAKQAGLSLFDRLLGALFGMVKGSLFVSIILMGLTVFTPTSRLLEGSELAPYFLVIGRAAIWLAPSQLRTRFYEGLDLVRRAQVSSIPPVLAPDARK